ncbi:MAG TPA: hypothetical protein VE029_01395 [Rhizobacter sp.]|nr:hypothetical protein [Rhizobacter sp.]
MQYSPHQLAYFAHRLVLRGPTHSMERMAGAVLVCNPPYISSGKVDTMASEISGFAPGG